MNSEKPVKSKATSARWGSDHIADVKWIGQRFADPDLDLAALARAQGAIAYGLVQRAGDLVPTLQQAASQTRAGKVVVKVAVAAEYDTAIAYSMVRGAR
jgi:hypothetical protein